MKKIIVIACLILIGNNAFSQKCKFDYDKVDPISGEKEQRIRFDFERIFSFAFYKKGSSYLTESYVLINGEQNFILEEGSKMDIKLSNGKVLTLKSISKTFPVSNAYASKIYTIYTISYFISKEELNDIEVNGISFIRTYLQNGTQYYDYTLKDKKTEKTKESAACMLSN